MDSLRITLLIIGAAFIAVVYAWERIKRRKNHDRYARWGVSDDSETHIIGRNSGDPETDSHLVSTAYDTEQFNDEEVFHEPAPEPEIETDALQVTTDIDEEIQQDDSEPDLDSDPELAVNQINDITSELEALEEIISQQPEQDEMELGDLDVPLDTTPTEPEKIIAIHVLAREGSTFNGADILANLPGLNLQHGDMDIFHRLDDNGHSVFSMANAIEPGTFDIAAMDELSTPALLFILSLPTSLPALEAYDNMLDAARSLADALDGRLCDETRSVLTRQAIDDQRSALNIL